MKKLFLIIVIVLVGCGESGDIEDPQTDFDLFAEYYQDCVEYCRADASWSMACGPGIYNCNQIADPNDKKLCVENDEVGLLRCVRHAWNVGCSNYTCAERVCIIFESNYAAEIALGNRDQYCTIYDNREDQRIEISLEGICN